jgi:large subunit ribosomal protein L13
MTDACRQFFSRLFSEGNDMSTYMANKDTVQRKWYIIDAAGKPLGHTAAQAAAILRGKHKPEFTPHVDCGDAVIILNSDKAVLTGKKMEQKVYRTHSGYVGGLKEVKYRILMQSKSDFAMLLAVKGMLPKNSIGRWSLRRLKVYKGATHNNEAQKPEVWAVQ